MKLLHTNTEILSSTYFCVVASNYVMEEISYSNGSLYLFVRVDFSLSLYTGVNFRSVNSKITMGSLLPRARMREGVKQSVFSVCLSGEKF